MKHRRLNTEGWVFVAIGCLGLCLTVPTFLLFGFSLADVLLVRDIVLVLPMAFDYGFILFGLWSLVEPLIIPSRDVDAGD